MLFLSDRLARALPFFYGYVMLPVAMMMQIATSPGQTFAVSPFMPALRESLQLSESRLGLAYMLGTMLAAVPLSLIGPIADRFGMRSITVGVVTALAGACWFASQVSNFVTLLIAFFLLRFLGQGSLSLLSSNTTSMWFRSRIGRVSAAISVGTAAAFAFVPGWLSGAIQDHGWRNTYQGLAVILVAGLIPMLLLLYRNRPEDLGQTVDGTAIDSAVQEVETSRADLDHLPTETVSLTLLQSLGTRAYYILGLTNILWALIGTGVLFYVYTLCDDRGFHQGAASQMFQVFGLSMLVAQFMGGVLADFLPLNRLFGIGTALIVLSLVCLAWAQQVALLHAFAVCFAVGQGLLISVGSVVWVRYYGRDHLGTIRGSIWCLTVAGSGCGPLIMGYFKDTTQSYDAAIWLFIGLMIPLAIAAWFVRPPKLLTHRKPSPATA
ncbi:MAG: MFS transporter [Planctomycetota bacterium]